MYLEKFGIVYTKKLDNNPWGGGWLGGGCFSPHVYFLSYETKFILFFFFFNAWILENIILSEVSQRKINTM